MPHPLHINLPLWQGVAMIRLLPVHEEKVAAAG